MPCWLSKAISNGNVFNSFDSLNYFNSQKTSSSKAFVFNSLKFFNSP